MVPILLCYFSFDTGAFATAGRSSPSLGDKGSRMKTIDHRLQLTGSPRVPKTKNQLFIHGYESEDAICKRRGS